MGTVSKALDLLDQFTRVRPLIGLSDLSRLARLNKATCYRMLCELQDYGFVEQVGSGREYRLGPAVLRLAALREATVPMRDAAMPILQSLANATGETAHLSSLAAGRLSTLAFAYSAAHGMKVMMEDADILPFHATSSGLAVMAYLPKAEQNAILAQPLAKLTAETETDVDSLRARLAEVQGRGMAESTGIYESGVHSLAVPLFDPSGRCAGALAVAVPAIRMNDALKTTIITELKRGGAAIIAAWGGTLPAELQTLWRDAA